MNINLSDRTSAKDLPDLKINDIETISEIKLRVTKEGDVISLKKDKENGTWTYSYGNEERPVTGEADEYTINRMLRKLNEFQLVSIKTRNPENYINYEIDDGSAVFVEIISENENQTENQKTELIIGGTDINKKYTFVRLPGKEPVYSTSGNIREVFNKKFIDVRDKLLFEFHWQDIVKVSITNRNGETAVFSKKIVDKEESEDDDNNFDMIDEYENPEGKEIIWTEESSGVRLNTGFVHNAIRQIWKFRALDFLDFPTSEQLNMPVIFKTTIYVETDDGKKEEHRFKVLRPYEADLKEENIGDLASKFSLRHLIQLEDIENPLYWVNLASINNYMKLEDIINYTENNNNE